MNEPPVQVTFTPPFRRALKRLRKKYPHIQSDIQPLIEQLANGEKPGDQVPLTGYTVYKARLPNRDAQRGKSGGYRIIYYLHTARNVVLLMIYSKSERPDISAGEIQKLIGELPEADGEG